MDSSQLEGTATPPATDPSDTGVGIRLEHVTKRFKGGVEAIRDVTLEVHPGEFVVLVGPSGCGKSTLLRMIAGLEEVTEGRVFIGGTDVTNQLAQKRDVAMVFQSYALYPRMSVERNMAFGLRMRHTPREERERRVHEVADMLGLEQLLDRRPAALSGGQRQRVAMGRALVREPRVFLMDEPLSNLDAKLRVNMRAQLSLLHEQLRITTVYVTHDQVEAMTLGQRVAVLRDGTLQQVDTPQRLYHEPVNLFVAAFIGSPSMNFAHGEVRGGTLAFAGLEVPVPQQLRGLPHGHRVVVGLRPTAFSTEGHPAWPAIDAVPELVEELGDERYLIFDVDSPVVDTDATRAALSERATDEALLLHVDRARFTARLMTDAPIGRGDTVRLWVNPERLYLFDRETGDAYPTALEGSVAPPATNPSNAERG